MELHSDSECTEMNGSGTKRSNKYFSDTNPVNFCIKGLFGIGRKSPAGLLAAGGSGAA